MVLPASPQKGMSALHWLAGDGYIEGVRLLLAAGADVHLKDAVCTDALSSHI
jgi:ankyrin repeat protein